MLVADDQHRKEALDARGEHCRFFVDMANG